MIRKIRNKELYRLTSSKTHRNLGTFPSRGLAIRREAQVNYFKQVKGGKSK